MQGEQKQNQWRTEGLLCLQNQKALIRDFLSKHPEIHVVSEKTDGGYSGVNFDRPAFQEMMDEIRSG